MLTETDMEKYRSETFWTKEPETIEWIKSFVDGDIFFDVGANIGVYSLYCAAIHPRCPVFSFEPDAKNYLRLIRNADMNRLRQIHFYAMAVLDRQAITTFYEASSEAGASGGQAGKIVDSDQASYKVQTTTIDALSEALSVPQHIKIDIDGQELKVIRGMTKTLQMCRLKSVLIEIDNGKEEIIADFIDNGFTMDNRFNSMTPHSRERRAKEGINVENIVFTRS